jgi:hypothetical protein
MSKKEIRVGDTIVTPLSKHKVEEIYICWNDIIGEWIPQVKFEEHEATTAVSVLGDLLINGKAKIE